METTTHGGLRSARVLAIGTSSRIVLTPVVMAIILNQGASTDDRLASGVAAVVFALAAATDAVDGRLARRWGVTTPLGAFLDTTADKLLVSGVLVALVAAERVSPWIVAIIIAREIALMGLRGLIAAEGTVMSPSRLGKLKTGVQFVAIILAIVRPDVVIAGQYLDEWAMVVAAAVTVWSGVDYLARALPPLVRDAGG